jgi:DNA-binding NarL/FixJ family response regulator
MAPPTSAAVAARTTQVKRVSRLISDCPRLRETVYYVSQGLANKAIARKMEISDNVVAEYVRNAFQQMKVNGRAGFMVPSTDRRGS